MENPYGMPPPMYPMMPPEHYPPPYDAGVSEQANSSQKPSYSQAEQALPNDKEALGEMLYPLVEKKNPKNASKITGMLLEMEVEHIHSILRSNSELDRWIAEALKVLANPSGT